MVTTHILIQRSNNGGRFELTLPPRNNQANEEVEEIATIRQVPLRPVNDNWLGICCICFEQQCKTIFIPCTHVCACEECTETLLENETAAVCLICRSHIQLASMVTLCCN